MINEANVICKMFTKVYNKLVEIYGENNFNVSLYLMYLFNVFTKQFFLASAKVSLEIMDKMITTS